MLVEDGGQPRCGLEAGQWRDLDFDYIYLRYVLFKSDKDNLLRGVTITN